MKVKVLVTQYLTLCNPWTVSHQAPWPWNFPGKDTEVGCHLLLQEIFPTQGPNPGPCTAGRFFTI